MTNEGQVKLSLPSAVRLAYLNSPDYQTQLETLYLSAIDVSTERFRFETQFFGTNNTTFTRQGPLNPNGETTTLETDTTFQLEPTFAAGENSWSGWPTRSCGNSPGRKRSATYRS